MDQRRTPWKWVLTIFKCKNEFPKQLGLMPSLVAHAMVFMPPSWVIVLKLSKIVSFLQFFAEVSKNSKAALIIYIYASESSRLVFFRKWYWLLCYDLEDISDWSWWIFVKFLLRSTLSLIVNSSVPHELLLRSL